MIKVSIIIPVIRPEKAERCVRAIRDAVDLPEDQYEILTEEDTKRIGCPKMVNKLTAKAKGEMICFLGDDTIPQPDFLRNAMEAMETFPGGWGLVGLNDNPKKQLSATHWLIHKKLIPLVGGVPFHEGYKHCFCDDELHLRSHQLGRFTYAYDAVIIHDHPLFDSGPGDFNDKINRSKDREYAKAYMYYNQDMELFRKRRMTNWQDAPEKTPKKISVAVGILTRDTVHTDFMLCLMDMYLQSMLSGVNLIIINQRSTLVPVGRNKIIEAAKKTPATHLLTLDSDMFFPPDTLLRLLKHGKDVVGCDASMRAEPFYTVVKDLKGARLNHRKKLAPLVKLSGGSCAVQLTKMSVYNKLKPPYFNIKFKKDGSHDGGEDCFFTRKLRAHRYDVFCDTKLSKQIGHMGVKTYYIHS